MKKSKVSCRGSLIRHLSAALMCLIAGVGLLHAQPIKVTGTVTSASDGEPLIGASVRVIDANVGATTDIDGNYTIQAEVGATVSFSYIGFITRELKVIGERLDIALEENLEVLDEVVVVGYGVQKKKLVTGATSQVKGEEIAKMNTTSPLQAMQGQMPGVNISSESGAPGSGMKVNIRGLGTVGNSGPLYLIGGAHVTLTDATGNVVGQGTYMLDIDNHTISFSDVFPLNTKEISDRTFRLLYLSETAMQIVPYNSNDAINYVTKDYFDNYVPDAAPEPELPEGWRNDITQTTNTALTWVISPENPLNWCTLAGAFMNDWKSASDYPDWLGSVEPSLYAGFSMTLDSADNSAKFIMPDGTIVNTTFTLDDKGIFTFEGSIPSFTVIGWASFAPDANNALRVMTIEKNDNGKVTGMWLGAKSSEKDEYLAYHFVIRH